MSQKYTPGPWDVELCSGCNPLVGTSSVSVAEILDDVYPDKEQQEANACLIAAAPDLLEALLNYMSQFGQALEAHGIAYSSSQQEADRLARLAIAKAEGK